MFHTDHHLPLSMPFFAIAHGLSNLAKRVSVYQSQAQSFQLQTIPAISAPAILCFGLSSPPSAGTKKVADKSALRTRQA